MSDLFGPDRREEIKDRASAYQRQAARPDTSVWVAASAGTGKTKVLIDRVLSLLLDGTPPERILCLTFTKAAAAEMANRLAVVLERWVAGPEEALCADLRRLTERDPDEELSARARGLFARVLDVPGGLKILTIHAFCQSLLGRFPLEAGVSPNFQVLDERSALEMLAAAREDVLSGATADAESARILVAVETVSNKCHDQGFISLIRELIFERARFARVLRRHGGLEGVRLATFRVLGADPSQSAQEVLTAACRSQAFDEGALRRVAAALRRGGKTDQERGARIAAWIADGARRPETLTDYSLAFLTKDGGVRSRLATKAVVAESPDALDVLSQEAARLLRLQETLNGLAVAEATAALLDIGAAILATYEAHKQARGLLDYDDLILKTRDLLSGRDAAAWVLFKLDGGLDHVLVDEAQDTNPEQWEVLARLTEEFFAGEGARPAPRTVFAVGDAKQSIYSFQRAKPEEFVRMRGHFRTRAEAAQQRWDQVDLAVCFRSVEPVLRAVDSVFREAPARDGLFLGDKNLSHQAVRLGDAGRVELWPPVLPAEKPEFEDWSLPIAREVERPAILRLAGAIAKKIWHWTLSTEGARDPESILESKSRRLQPGDILVLVRRRNDFVDALVRALKDLDVPVAGVDRMLLTEQLAIMDLVALGRVLLMPEDDLTLATVLKGPFFALSEEQLFVLAHDREDSLWQALARRAGDDPDFADCHARLSELRGQTDLLRPYELYARLLGPGGGRKRLLARLGPEAADPIDEFLSLALTHETEHVPSLESFLHWLSAGAPEVKRDLEHGQNAVRVMTVHGAKGLQAPVVFLPDTMQTPQAGSGLLWLEDEDLVLWPLRKSYDGAAATTARGLVRERQNEEYRRLLYVAMTRAEDRLYVCGWQTRKDPPADCWYNLVLGGLDAIEHTEAYPFVDEEAGGGEAWTGTALRLTGRQTAVPDEAKEVALATRLELPPSVALPDWLQRPAPAEPTPPRPLAPSRPDEEEPAIDSPLGEDRGSGRDAGLRFRRGLLIHRLLETLPQVQPDRREAAGRRFLGRPTHDLTAEEQEEILGETLAVLNDSGFAALFGPRSRPEVPLVGLVETSRGPEVVSGQIDRLLVEDSRVAIVDYKSNRPPPELEAGVPGLYLRQMASYRALLRPIYPGKSIDCYLLWTAVPRLMQLSDVSLADHAP